MTRKDVPGKLHELSSVQCEESHRYNLTDRKPLRNMQLFDPAIPVYCYHPTDLRRRVMM